MSSSIIKTRAMDQYELKEENFGTGGSGHVKQAVRQSDGTLWAIKTIESENFPHLSKDIFREACFMQDIMHPNIVRIESCFLHGEEICFVMKPYQYNLRDYIYQESLNYIFPKRIPEFLRDILSAVAYLHDRGIMHRDLKGDNEGGNKMLKLIDFGLARGFGGFNGDLSPRRGTLTYMAPEILLGSTNYTTAVDMWSIGCVLAEMAIGDDIFFGHSEPEVFKEICSKLGRPMEQEWPGVCQLLDRATWTSELPSNPTKELVDLHPKLKQWGDNGLKLLMRFLTWNPAKRITAAEALEDEYLKQRNVE